MVYVLWFMVAWLTVDSRNFGAAINPVTFGPALKNFLRRNRGKRLWLKIDPIFN